jgi:hypothetical protein
MEFAPLKYQIAEKIKYSPLLPYLNQEQKSLPIFESSVKKIKKQNPLIESREDLRLEIEGEEILELEMDTGLVSVENETEWDFYGTYEVDRMNYKQINTEATHQFDIDNVYFDPNQFSIINTISNENENKRVLLDEFPELKCVINNELGFALEKKK